MDIAHDDQGRHQDPPPGHSHRESDDGRGDGNLGLRLQICGPRARRFTSFTPTTGTTSGTTTVTITGTSFYNVTSVRFGTTTAKSFTVTSSTTIKAVTKPHVAAQ